MVCQQACSTHFKLHVHHVGCVSFMQVVWAPHYNVLGGAVSFGDQDVPPLHLAVHDATGASLVVQFKDGAMQVLRNPMGVLANSPFLQQQVQVRAGSA